MLLLLWFDFRLGRDSSWDRPGLIIGLLAIITAAMAASELVSMFDNVASRVNPKVVIGTTVTMVIIACVPLLRAHDPNCPMGNFGWAFGGLACAAVIAFVVEMMNFDISHSSAKGEVIDRLARLMFVLVYLGMLVGFLIPHRLLQNDNALGLIALIALIATVKLSDSFAYFAGKQFGTVKLAPKLSPGKTLQGSLGAIVGGCVAAAIMVFLVAPIVFDVTIQKPWWWFLLYGLLVTCAGMVGDLAESLIKRDSATKDSSRWLPGLGGVLDILDSMIFAAPVSYFLWIVADLPTTAV